MMEKLTISDQLVVPYKILISSQLNISIQNSCHNTMVPECKNTVFIKKILFVALVSLTGSKYG